MKQHKENRMKKGDVMLANMRRILYVRVTISEQVAKSLTPEVLQAYRIVAKRELESLRPDQIIDSATENLDGTMNEFPLANLFVTLNPTSTKEADKDGKIESITNRKRLD